MSEQRIFTYEEALESFPAVRDRTAAAVREVELLHAGGATGGSAEQRKEDVAEAVKEVVREWAESILAMGCEVKGLWLVDWDSGDGYYCWRYPESSLAHYHSYDEGFAGRVPIQ